MKLQDLLSKVSNQTRFVLGASFANSYWSCPRRFWYTNVLRIRPKRPDISVARDAGTYFHTIVSETHKSPDFRLSVGIEAARDQANATLDMLDKYMNTLTAVDEHQYVLKAIADTRQAVEKAEAMATVWFDKYPPSYTQDQIILVEKRIIMPLNNSPILFLQGTPDLVVENKDQLWIVDYKSTGFNIDLARAGRFFSLQTAIYPELVKHELERPVRGFIYHYIQRPTIKFCRKDADLSAYIARVYAWYETQADKCFFSEVFPCLPIPDIDHLLSPITRSFVSPAHRCDPNLWPRMQKSCSDFQHLCPFLPLCESTPKVWDSKLTADFEEREENDA